MNALEEQRAVVVNGIELHVELRGAGEPLLLLHGFLGCGRDWTHVFDLDDLGRHHRLIIPDLRGHGRTSNPGGTFSHRQCADDVATLLAALGVTRCRAIGLSLGGNTLLHLATRPDNPLAAMVVVSAPPYFPAPARAFMKAFTADAQPPAEWDVLRARHVHGDEQIRALFAHVQTFAAGHDDMCFTPPLLATIAVPTLIVYGDRDPLYPVELALELYRAIPGAALCVVPRGGHGPIFRGAEKDGFVRLAREFLSAA